MTTDTAHNSADFFAGCYDDAAIKTRFRDLCKIHHPDLGGDLATMQRLNAAYEAALRGEYRKTMSDDDAENAVEMDAQVAAKVAEIIGIEGLIVELIGRWVWVTGDTFPARATLKTAGFFWASKKEAWYYRKDEDHAGRGGRKSLEEIKAKYGVKSLSRRTGVFSRPCLA
jgi:hypothetical protein